MFKIIEGDFKNNNKSVESVNNRRNIFKKREKITNIGS